MDKNGQKSLLEQALHLRQGSASHTQAEPSLPMANHHWRRYADGSLAQHLLKFGQCCSTVTTELEARLDGTVTMWADFSPRFRRLELFWCHCLSCLCGFFFVIFEIFRLSFIL